MAPLAGMLREHGYRVTGRNRRISTCFDIARDPRESEYYDFFDRASHARAGLVIVGNAISRGNPEVERCWITDCRTVRCRKCIEEDFSSRAHIRSSSAARTAKPPQPRCWPGFFTWPGKRPNFLVGGMAENFGKSYGSGGGEEFILEGDEYDSRIFGQGRQIPALPSRRSDHHFARIRSRRYLRRFCGLSDCHSAGW